MFLTIIIPTRNRPKDLKVCLKHIELQSFSDYEVLIIDDGSKTEVCEQYSDLIPAKSNFQLINSSSSTVEGMGVSIVRNIGLEKAKGRYITFCDDDDYWTDENHLKIAHDTLTKHNIDMYFANQNAVWEKGKESHSDWFPYLSTHIQKYICLSQVNSTYLLNRKQLLRESEIPQLNTLIIKKDICHKINGFWSRLTYLEDRDFYLRTLEYCTNVCYRKDIVSQHNIPATSKRISISNSILKKDHHILMISVLNHVLANTKQNEIVKFCKMFLGWEYRNLSLITKKQTQIVFANHALANLFTFKWFIFTIFLKVKFRFSSLIH